MLRKLLLITLLLSSPLYAAELVEKKPAPDFTLASKGGDNIRLEELRGQVVLLNFWASWCGPCRQEMPELQKLQNKYAELGFTVLGVNVEEDHEAADRIVDKGKLDFPILYDSENVVSKLYSVRAMPTTIIIDRDGNMRYLYLAYKPGYEEKYAAAIKALLREF